jgi:hypothetical protein
MPIQSPSGFVQCPTPTPPPGREGVGAEGGVTDLGFQAAIAADAFQPDDYQRDQPCDDHEELQDLVVNRAGQTAECDVGQHEQRRDGDRQPDRPADQRVDDQRQGVQVHPGSQHRGRSERHGVEQVGGRVEAPEQELRHAAHPGPVVERHHDDAEEHHRRDRADPVEMHCRQAVLSAVRGHAQDLDGPEVGGDEGQAGNPGGQRPAGQQEVLAHGDGPPGHHPDRDDQDEIDRQDDVVKRVDMKPEQAHHLR